MFYIVAAAGYLKKCILLSVNLGPENHNFLYTCLEFVKTLHFILLLVIILVHCVHEKDTLPWKLFLLDETNVIHSYWIKFSLSSHLVWEVLQCYFINIILTNHAKQLVYDFLGFFNEHISGSISISQSSLDEKPLKLFHLPHKKEVKQL